jgi:serine/threonine-protein kinase
MKSEEFEPTLEEDNLSVIVEQFKDDLIKFRQGNSESLADKKYREIRQKLRTVTIIDNLLPAYIHECRSLNDLLVYFNDYPIHETMQEKAREITRSFNPIIERLEDYEEGGNLDFSTTHEEKEVIGTGGFAQVYKYKHIQLDLHFAVKIFYPAFYNEGKGELNRFFQEARMLFTLNHPNIIRIYDAGLFKKRPFIKMEYFMGLSLNQLLEKQGVLSFDKTLIIIEKVVNAIAHAHDKAIIHRDLHMSNVMVDENQFENLKVIDFGLGVFIENELYSRLTEVGNQVISGHYTAPELIANPKLIDMRSDIYSIGAIWYTLLTNQVPAGSSIYSTLQNIKDIEEEQVKCIEKCLASIDRRYNNCQELLNDINKLKN